MLRAAKSKAETVPTTRPLATTGSNDILVLAICFATLRSVASGVVTGGRRCMA
jgi:hypothetical protein